MTIWLGTCILCVTASQVTTTVWPKTTFTPDMTEYCPNHRTCDDGDDDEASTLWFDGCCLRCDCSDECFLKGNCCPGKKHREISMNKTCTQTFIDFVPDEFYGKILYKNSSYILKLSDQTFCNDETMAKCLHPNSSVLNENIPMFDKSNRVNYRNKFCAQCDGAAEANIISWPVSISCFTAPPNTVRYALKHDGNNDFHVIERLREHSCTILWEPPELDSVQWCVHPEDIISTCLSFGYVDFSVFKNCIELQSEQSNNTLHVPIFQDGGLFKNAACAKCNSRLIPITFIRADNCTPPSFLIPLISFVIKLDMNALQHPETPGDCLHYSKVFYLNLFI